MHGVLASSAKSDVLPRAEFDEVERATRALERTDPDQEQRATLGPGKDLGLDDDEDDKVGEEAFPGRGHPALLATSNRTRPRRLMSERLGNAFRGTSLYASIRAHRGREVGRSDDLWCMFYGIVDLMAPNGLPWREDSSDRDACAAGKARFLLQPKAMLPPDTPGLDLIAAVSDHLLTLSYYSSPDYALVAGLLTAAADVAEDAERQLASQVAGGLELPPTASSGIHLGRSPDTEPGRFDLRQVPLSCDPLLSSRGGDWRAGPASSRWDGGFYVPSAMSLRPLIADPALMTGTVPRSSPFQPVRGFPSTYTGARAAAIALDRLNLIAAANAPVAPSTAADSPDGPTTAVHDPTSRSSAVSESKEEEEKKGTTHSPREEQVAPLPLAGVPVDLTGASADGMDEALAVRVPEVPSGLQRLPGMCIVDATAGHDLTWWERQLLGDDVAAAAAAGGEPFARGLGRLCGGLSERAAGIVGVPLPVPESAVPRVAVLPNDWRRVGLSPWIGLRLARVDELGRSVAAYARVAAAGFAADPE